MAGLNRGRYAVELSPSAPVLGLRYLGSITRKDQRAQLCADSQGNYFAVANGYADPLIKRKVDAAIVAASAPKADSATTIAKQKSKDSDRS